MSCKHSRAQQRCTYRAENRHTRVCSISDSITHFTSSGNLVALADNEPPPHLARVTMMFSLPPDTACKMVECAVGVCFHQLCRTWRTAHKIFGTAGGKGEIIYVMARSTIIEVSFLGSSVIFPCKMTSVLDLKWSEVTASTPLTPFFSL